MDFWALLVCSKPPSVIWEVAGTLRIAGLGETSPSSLWERKGDVLGFKAGSHSVVQTGLELQVVLESQLCATPSP